MKRMLEGLKTMALLNIVPASAVLAATEPEELEKLHYTPLNGLTLREIAAKKLHHSDNGRYLNPMGELRRRRRLGKVLYWKLFSDNEFKQHLDDQPVVSVNTDWNQVKNSSGLSITFVKHASVMIKDGDKYFIVDPVFQEIFRFITDYSPLAFDLKDMPQPDHILITHGHYDHINKPSLATFDKNTHVISPLGYDSIFNELGMKNRTQMDWYDVYRDDQREITFLPSNHWTMRNPILGPNRSLWGSYLFKTAGGKTIYISGDTAYFDGFEEIGKEFDIDLAIMNLGAYEPRWFMAPSHMNPQETVDAFKQLRAKKLMIVHWGTFRLGDEPVHFPPMDLRNKLEKQGLLDRWVDIKHGETYNLVGSSSYQV
jgi:L-ascorbate metabolism protein UlaG (beta-lactamase superfamily)